MAPPELKVLFDKLDTPKKGILNFITNFNKVGKQNQTKGLVKGRVELLHEYWTRFYNIHEQIMVTADAADKREEYFTSDIYFQVEASYIEAKGILSDLFETLLKQEAVTLNTTSNLETPAAYSNGSSFLPKLTIPKFNGNYLEWPSFRDMFETLIIQNTNLSDVQRLQYLKSNLTGEAEKLLRNLAITNANFKSAWDLLKERYENPRILINVLLKSIMSLPKVASDISSGLKRLSDGTCDALKALENLGRPVEHWDDWLIYITVQKLDADTRKDWENKICTTAHSEVTFSQLRTFLEGKIRASESISSTSSPVVKGNKVSTNHVHSDQSVTYKGKCQLCSGKHILMFCPIFKAKSLQDRRNFVLKQNACYNCLSFGHLVSACLNQKRCRICSKRHHTLLHDEPKTVNSQFNNSHTSQTPTSLTSRNPESGTVNQIISEPSSNAQAITNSARYQGSVNNHLIEQPSQNTIVLLATASVILCSPSGDTIRARALIDQGSEASFISSSLVRRLNLTTEQVDIPISGLCATTAGRCQHAANLEIRSHYDPNFSLKFDALVLPKLTNFLPSRTVKAQQWPHITNLTLADPSFERPGKVDLLIGADIFPNIILEGVKKGSSAAPIAQLTTLGWVLSGPVLQQGNNNSRKAKTFHLQNDKDLNRALEKFWEFEEIPKSSHFTSDELECLRFYEQTVSRDNNGRYIVRLPLRAREEFTVKRSRELTTRCFNRMEKHILSNPQLAEDYRGFMNEYVSLGHMKLTSQTSNEELQHLYYLPHHPVLKEDSTTTKLRVVFNASFKTANGLSLNDQLHVGPKLQTDLLVIILKWRTLAVVFSADIEKMYRQVLIHEQDQDLQRIVWRDFPTEELRDYKLLTVTYGMACAPYLAIQTLRQLVCDEGLSYPIGATALLENTYVDDVLAGGADLNSALECQHQLINLLKAGGFNLRKWTSNRPELLKHLPADQRHHHAVDLNLDQKVKTLGIEWKPITDEFEYRLLLDPPNNIITKRTVLSTISRLFDPLGWLAPIIIGTKILMQKLWLEKLDWDTPLPEHLRLKWTNIREDLSNITSIRIPRWTGNNPSQLGYQLHGFSDASELAYSAVVYMRVLHDFENIQTSLFVAKSKVSPVKRVSLPRLELCGAHLLAKLLDYIQTKLKFEDVSIFAWSDSTTVLAWLKSHPQRLNSFVANRVGDIQTILKDVSWKYVHSKDNPADLATRGISAEDLRHNELWWNGPKWLSSCSSLWPQTLVPKADENLLELKPLPMSSYCTLQIDAWTLIDKFSSLTKAVRITAYVQRFITNLRTCPESRNLAPLSTLELETALRFWIGTTQRQVFAAELDRLKRIETISHRSKLLNLQPFLDDHNLLRVGGRLKNSQLSFSEKHPLILPKGSSLTKLIVKQAHVVTLHGGESLTMSYIRRKYWIINLRQEVKSVLRACIVCFKQRAAASQQIMAHLPESRTVPTKPFHNAGIDYAGPIQLRTTKGRGHKSYKGYICLFVCFSTKALHLEVVSDLTTQGFLAAFKRFSSRRGIPSHVFSDNATNFVGAQKELHFNLSSCYKQFHKEIAEALAISGTQWHFIPASSPHFGGLWEAGVKSVKGHLKRIIGVRTLTFEELTTVLCQIEAVLNSRPLCPLNTDPMDNQVLTPGHFLVGSSVTLVPEPSSLDVPSNRLSRWQLVQQMYESFWRIWSHEYLHTLQQRGKWNTNRYNVKVDDLVLIKEERLPPSQWLLGRIVGTHPGNDGKVRVVSVKCRQTILKRPVVKICPLPFTQDSL